MKKSNMKNEIISLNEETFMDFSVEELEQRLETDPLFLANLVNLGAGGDAQPTDFCIGCNNCKGGDYTQTM